MTGYCSECGNQLCVCKAWEAEKKRAAPCPATQLTMRHLRKQGWPLVEKVEHYDVYQHRTHDLFGFIDIIAVRRNETLGVQTTSYQHVGERVTKIAEHPNVAAVREAGWVLKVHGWRKVKGRWVLAREVDVS